MQHNLEHIPGYIISLEPFIKQYGYLAIASLLFLEDFGILVPGETVLVAGAVYASLGQLNIFIVMLVGVIACVLGDNVGYLIGNKFGHPILERYGKYVFMTKERIDKAEHFFSKYGNKIIVVARFFDGLRELNGILAGLSEIKWRRFNIYNLIGSVSWVVFWSLIGFYGGAHINTFIKLEILLTIIIIGVFIIKILHSKLKTKS